MAILKGVGAAIKGFGKALTGKNKVGPTITSVKPSVTVRKKGMKASIKKAKGEDTNIGFKEEDNVEKAMKIISEYDPKLEAKMKREGIKNATEVINEKEPDEAGLDDINYSFSQYFCIS